VPGVLANAEKEADEFCCLEQIAPAGNGRAAVAGNRRAGRQDIRQADIARIAIALLRGWGGGVSRCSDLRAFRIWILCRGSLLVALNLGLIGAQILKICIFFQ